MPLGGPGLGRPNLSGDQRYYGAIVGDECAADIVYGDETTSRPVQLTFNVATSGLNKLRVILALDAIRQKIIQGKWPPGAA